MTAAEVMVPILLRDLEHAQAQRDALQKENAALKLKLKSAEETIRFNDSYEHQYGGTQ